MFKYSKADEVLKEKLSSYTNKGEYLLVSDVIKYNQIEYREVLFNKNFVNGRKQRYRIYR